MKAFLFLILWGALFLGAASGAVAAPQTAPPDGPPVNINTRKRADAPPDGLKEAVNIYWERTRNRAFQHLRQPQGDGQQVTEIGPQLEAALQASVYIRPLKHCLSKSGQGVLTTGALPKSGQGVSATGALSPGGRGPHQNKMSFMGALPSVGRGVFIDPHFVVTSSRATYGAAFDPHTGYKFVKLCSDTDCQNMGIVVAEDLRRDFALIKSLKPGASVVRLALAQKKQKLSAAKAEFNFLFNLFDFKKEALGGRVSVIQKQHPSEGVWLYKTLGSRNLEYIYGPSVIRVPGSSSLDQSGAPVWDKDFELMGLLMGPADPRKNNIQKNSRRQNNIQNNNTQQNNTRQNNTGPNSTPSHVSQSQTSENETQPAFCSVLSCPYSLFVYSLELLEFIHPLRMILLPLGYKVGGDVSTASLRGGFSVGQALARVPVQPLLWRPPSIRLYFEQASDVQSLNSYLQQHNLQQLTEQSFEFFVNGRVSTSQQSTEQQLALSHWATKNLQCLGYSGSPRRSVEAQWAHALAENEHPWAQALLGHMYFRSCVSSVLGVCADVKKNHLEAFHWFEQAALGGEVSAFIWLAHALQKRGELEQAAYWYDKAGRISGHAKSHITRTGPEISGRRRRIIRSRGRSEENQPRINKKFQCPYVQAWQL